MFRYLSVRLFVVGILGLALTIGVVGLILLPLSGVTIPESLVATVAAAVASFSHLLAAAPIAAEPVPPALPPAAANGSANTVH